MSLTFKIGNLSHIFARIVLKSFKYFYAMFLVGSELRKIDCIDIWPFVRQIGALSTAVTSRIRSYGIQIESVFFFFSFGRLNIVNVDCRIIKFYFKVRILVVDVVVEYFMRL